MEIWSCRSLRHVLALFCSVLFFQNCGKFQSDYEMAEVVPSLASISLNECDPNALDCPGGVTRSAVKDDEEGSSTNVCRFNGRTYKIGDLVVAYPTSTVDYGSICTPELRVCTQLGLTGSANFASCEVGGPKACLFNGITVEHGDPIAAYKKSAVAFDEVCTPTALVCSNGKLVPNPELTPYRTCEVGGGKSCNYNGGSLKHNQMETLYTTQSVPFGTTCKVARVSCFNGKLSQEGEFYSSCQQREGKTCEHGDLKIKHDAFVTRYASEEVPFGEKCTPVKVYCFDGKLANDLDVFQFKSCKTAEPENCNYVGGTLGHDKEDTLYTTSRVPFGQKCSDKKEIVKCFNGKFSKNGNFYGKCEEDKPRNCSGNGLTLNHKGTGVVYKKSYVPFGQSCTTEKVAISCFDGKFSVDQFSTSCKTGEPKVCSGNGLTLSHGGQRSVFRKSSVPFGQSCTSEKFTVTCNNGQFSNNSFTLSCSTGTARNCSENGIFISHGGSEVLYLAPRVPHGSRCDGRRISCNDGRLSEPIGNRVHKNCGVALPPPPAACRQGNIVWPHGKRVSGFTASVVPFGQSCRKVTISCNNGNFDGNPATLLWNSCRQEEAERWVNIPWEPNAPTKTHEQACRDVGMFPSTKYGGCASGRVYPSEGNGWDQIHYTHGKPQVINPNGGWQRRGTRLQFHKAPIQLGMYTNKIKCVPEKKKRILWTDVDDLAQVWGTHDVVVAYLCTNNRAESSTLPMTVVEPAVDPCYPNGCR